MIFLAPIQGTAQIAKNPSKGRLTTVFINIQEKKVRKTVAITGSTGGLGSLIVKDLAKDFDLVLVDRNINKSRALAEEISATVPTAKTDFVTCDLADFESVKSAVNALIGMDIHILMLNSGVYNVPVYKCTTGYNNIFQINFLSQYYMARRMAEESKTLEKVVITSSVAHRYSPIDVSDIDFSTRKQSAKKYGNSKRFLTFALYEYFKGVEGKKLAVAHPGVTLTNVTNHYPKFINPIVKLGIKIFFPSPKKAIRSLLAAVRSGECGYMEWIGPAVFDVWGKPKKSILKSCSVEESKKIGETAESIFKKLR